MDRKAIYASLGIILAIVAGVAYLLLTSGTQQAAQDMRSQNTTRPRTVQPSTETVNVQEAVKEKGQYLDYSEGAVSAIPGTKLLFFHAAWCPQCRTLENDILNQGIPPNIVIFKVDYDSNQSLRQKYGVNLQTTIVKVDDQGKLLDKFVAYDDPSLEAVLKELL